MDTTKLFPTTIVNRKRLCVRLWKVINTAWKNLKAQIGKPVRSICSPDWFLLCDLQVFLRSVYHFKPPHAQSIFSDNFGKKFDSFSPWEEGRCARTFDPLTLVLSQSLTEPFENDGTKSANSLATEGVSQLPMGRMQKSGASLATALLRGKSIHRLYESLWFVPCLLAVCLLLKRSFLSGAVCWVFSKAYTKEEYLLVFFRG